MQTQTYLYADHALISARCAHCGTPATHWTQERTKDSNTPVGRTTYVCADHLRQLAEVA